MNACLTSITISFRKSASYIANMEYLLTMKHVFAVLLLFLGYNNSIAR